jgi:hypothetical protein
MITVRQTKRITQVWVEAEAPNMPQFREWSWMVQSFGNWTDIGGHHVSKNTSWGNWNQLVR